MRSVFVLAGLSAAIVLADPLDAQQTGRGGRGGGRGTPIQPGESCPAGTTEIRPRSCMAPEFPAPSILDYRPKSTLIAPEHPVKTAKYPAIDYHGHPQGLLGSAAGLDSLGRALDALNVRMMVSADNMSGERLKTTLANVRASEKMKDRVRILAGINFQNVGPGWAEKAVAQLEADIAAGAVGVGEIGKGFGISTKKPDGSRLKLDDPELDPIWDACARLKIPVFIHTADPQEFFYKELDFERALARARAVRRPPLSARSVSELRDIDDGTRQPVPQASEDDVRCGAHGVARQRPWPPREDDGRNAESLHGGRRRSL